MQQSSHPDIFQLVQAYDAVERDARTLMQDLPVDVGAWRSTVGSWSVAECLDHLATANRVYLAAMRPSAEEALRDGQRRRRPARPGLVGGWFVRSLEPPAVRLFRTKAPRQIEPRDAPSLEDAFRQFVASQEEVRAFVRRYAEIDLSGVRFPNPFVRGIRFSLATGLHVIAAHQRRHLWQAWRVRAAAERALNADATHSARPDPRSDPAGAVPSR